MKEVEIKREETRGGDEELNERRRKSNVREGNRERGRDKRKKEMRKGMIRDER